jgi:hypothetical protein
MMLYLLLRIRIAIFAACLLSANCQGGSHPMEPITTPPFQVFSVLEENSTGGIQIFASYRDSKSGELKTQEFFENIADGRSMRPSKPVGWEHILPADLQPLGCSAGTLNDFFGTFWETWNVGSNLHALALTQEDPIVVSMQPSDVRIQPPILGKDKKLRVFFWRKQEAGYGLFQHVFSGEMDHKGSVTTEKILNVPYKPGFSRADPVSLMYVRKIGIEEKGTAVIGWLSSEGGDMRVHAAWLHGLEAKIFDSDPIAGYKPHTNQRIGLYGHPQGSIHLSWLMGREDSEYFRAADWTVDVHQEMKSIRISEKAFTGTKIHSSACVHWRSGEGNESACFLLTESGILYEHRAKERLRKLRSDVPLNYDFPIFASLGQTYEARIKPDGTFYFDYP